MNAFVTAQPRNTCKDMLAWAVDKYISYDGESIGFRNYLEGHAMGMLDMAVSGNLVPFSEISEFRQQILNARKAMEGVE